MRVTDFLLNSDYEMDKIVWVHNMHVTNALTTTMKVDVPVNLCLLIIGFYSTNSDFSESRMIGDGIVRAGSYTDGVGEEAIKNTVIEVYVDGVREQGQVNDVYIKLYGLLPTKYKEEEIPEEMREYINSEICEKARVKPTNVNANKFIINTNNNYLKLVKKCAPLEGVKYEHNLGYVPQVLAWHDMWGLSHSPTSYFEHTFIVPEQSTPYISGLMIDKKSAVAYTPWFIPFASEEPMQMRIYGDEC